MAHFAKINSDSIVEIVHVINNAVITKEDGTEDEAKGKDFLNSLFGSATWVQTSYNNNFRKNYAAVGYTYDSISCLLYTSPSPRDVEESRMPSSA